MRQDILQICFMPANTLIRLVSNGYRTRTKFKEAKPRFLLRHFYRQKSIWWKSTHSVAGIWVGRIVSILMVKEHLDRVFLTDTIIKELFNDNASRDSHSLLDSCLTRILVRTHTCLGEGLTEEGLIWWHVLTFLRCRNLHDKFDLLKKLINLQCFLV